MRARPSRHLMRLLPLVLLSGACALVYQIAWTRDFRLVFGASTPASAAVVAIFIGGLGLGALRLGAAVERTARPLRLYAVLEAGIAASSAASPLLLALARHAYAALGGSVSLGGAGATIARLALATLVLAIPTFLMGGTLPALARVALAESAPAADPSRRAVGLLYGVNTLGAVLGCTVANFALVERLGTHATLWLATLVNAAVALAAFGMARAMPDASPAGPSDSPEAPSTGGETAARPVAPTPFVLGAAAVAGFAFFLMELVFYRMLVPLLGGTVYTFGLVLAVALLGIGLGGTLYAAVFGRREARLASFAATSLLEAAALALPYALGDRVALLALYLRPHDPHGLRSYAGGWLLVTAIVVLPASIASGVQFPMLVALLGRGARAVARDVGRTYAWNTVGAIGGAVAGGFGLMPLLTAPGCWRLAMELLVAAGLLAAVLDARARGRGRLGRAAVSVVLASLPIVALVAARGPTAAWRHSAIGVGRIGTPALEPTAIASFLRDARRGIAWEADGIESTVGLYRSNGLSFLVNAKSDGHCVADAGTQVMGGLLGALLHPAPRTAMVIGLGSGSTAGWLATAPAIERVDVVELEPAMLEVARRCATANAHALEQPKLHVAQGDAREVLAVTRQRYDIVFSEPSNPYRAGVASLYTREYYARVREHLAEGGLFVQWVQGYEIDGATMRTIFATLASEFPYVEAWQLEEPDLALVASRTPIAKDVGRLRARVASEPFARALHVAWGVDDVEGLLAHFVARASFARSIAAAGADPLNTDDRPVAEFGFARMLASDDGGDGRVSVRTVRGWAVDRGEGDAEVTGGEVDADRVALERAEIPSFYEGRPPYDPATDASDEARLRLDVLRQWALGENEAALAAWDAHPGEPSTTIEARALAEAAVGAKDPRAYAMVAKLAPRSPIDALALEAQLLERDGRLAEAADRVERALVAYRSDPWATDALVWRAVRLTSALARADHALAPRMLAAVSQPFAADELHNARVEAELWAHGEVEGWDGCAGLYAQLEPDTPWNATDLERRRNCYVAARDPRARVAEEELARFDRRGWWSAAAALP